MSERDIHQAFDQSIQRGINQYIAGLFVHESEAQLAIRTNTVAQGLPQIDLRPQEGWLLCLLTRMIAAKTAVEFGTLAGYSATWIAQGLSDSGKLITLEMDERHAQIARDNFVKAGVAEKIEVRVGNAHDIIKTLHGPFDLAFIDADKEGYDVYLNWALENVRVGGLIIAHNAFRNGTVIQAKPDEATQYIQRFNTRVAATERLLSTIIPVGDGMLIALVQ